MKKSGFCRLVSDRLNEVVHDAALHATPAKAAERDRFPSTRQTSWLRMDVQRDDHQGGGMRYREVYPGSAFTPDSRALYTTWDGGIGRVEIPSGRRRLAPGEVERGARRSGLRGRGARA